MWKRFKKQTKKKNKTRYTRFTELSQACLHKHISIKLIQQRNYYSVFLKKKKKKDHKTIRTDNRVWVCVLFTSPVLCDAGEWDQSKYKHQNQQEQDEASLEPRQLLPFL